MAVAAHCDDVEFLMNGTFLKYYRDFDCEIVYIQSTFLDAKKRGYDGSLIFAQTVTSGSYGRFFNKWDVFTDISGFSEIKREAIGMHACQVPHPENLDHEDRQRDIRCGASEAKTFYVYEISETRQSRITEDLKCNHEYCQEKFQKKFFNNEFNI